MKCFAFLITAWCLALCFATCFSLSQVVGDLRFPQLEKSALSPEVQLGHSSVYTEAVLLG